MTYVTKSSLIALLADEDKRAHVIGRALVVLFKRQTEAEKATNSTRVHNNRGFNHHDAKWGTIMAKFYIKNKTLSAAAVRQWMKPEGARGTPRIAKYWSQLDEAARENHEAKLVAARTAVAALADLTESEKALGEPIAADTNPTDVIPSPSRVTVTFDLNDLRDALRYAEGK